MNVVAEQSPPVERPDRTPVWPMVVADFQHQHPEEWKNDDSIRASVRRVVDDMRARDAVGRERYGVPLTAGNGRDSLVDAYQELLDGAAYLRTELEQTTMSAAELGHLQAVYRRTLDSVLTVRWLLDRRAEANPEGEVEP